MECQILFSGKIREIMINLPSVEYVQKVVKYFLGVYIQRSQYHGKKSWNVKSYFLER